MSTQRKDRPVRPIPDALDPEETLAAEKRWLPRAGVLAIAAGILTVIGFFVQFAIQGGAPDDTTRFSTVPQTLLTYASGQQGTGIHGHQAAFASYLADNSFGLILTPLISGLSFVAAGFVLFGLLRASWRRRPSFPRWFMWLPIVGGIALALGSTFAKVYLATKLSDFNSLAPDLQTNAAARVVLSSERDDLGGLAIVSVLGQMFVAVGIGAAALSAMNVGLLTRVMGMLGVLLAMLVVVPLLGVYSDFLRAFWLIALGFVLLGRWPGGRPPAWVTGLPQPWPSRAMLLEAAERERAQKAAGEARPAPKPKAPSGGRKRRK